MATLIFVIFWVLVAVALLFIALSGGARGARERLHGQSRTGRLAALVVFGLALVLFGAVIPAAVVNAVEERESIPEANVAKLT